MLALSHFPIRRFSIYSPRSFLFFFPHHCGIFLITHFLFTRWTHVWHSCYLTFIFPSEEGRHPVFRNVPYTYAPTRSLLSPIFFACFFSFLSSAFGIYPLFIKP